MVVLPDSRRLLIPLKSKLYLLNCAKSYSAKVSKKERKAADRDNEKKKDPKENEIKLKANEIKDGSEDKHQHSDSEEETMQNNKDGKKNKKRKRKQVTDLRFETTLDKLGGSSKRRERKKKCFEAKKKKHKNARTEENLDFPGRENIKFGDVVEAPLKLVTVPKGSKILLDASKERLRLQAIEAYRNRKGWTSRPGAPQLPPATT
ncbi:protein PXR1-like isoform X2 [Durio zibethinus]|uniref:Protein PXR1-like isoform X2 n=1 Tax=Durio zibethinus TaxID=66656 RepID=A0A6P5ZWG3_DURZI|nr:protein PXR1-like isoform X2 [Durio zibethinus]